MTGTTPASTLHETTSERAPLRKTGWLRRHRAIAAFSAVVAAALGLVLWAQLSPKGDAVPLSVHNAGPEGARAVTQILERHSVAVQDAGSYEAATWNGYPRL